MSPEPCLKHLSCDTDAHECFSREDHGRNSRSVRHNPHPRLWIPGERLTHIRTGRPHEGFDSSTSPTQYSHLITRRCRELNVYAELLPCTQKLSELNFIPKGLFELGGKKRFVSSQNVSDFGSQVSSYLAAHTRSMTTDRLT